MNMKNIVLEELNRARLLMNYDSKTTLSENLERVPLLEDKEIILEQGRKAFLKSIFGTSDDIAVNALKRGKDAKYLAGVKLFDDVAVYGQTGLKSGDEVMNALIKGTLTKSQLSELAKGLMKTGKATGGLRTTLTNKAADLVVKDARYANLSQKQIKDVLVKKGYNPAVADEIAAKSIANKSGVPGAVPKKPGAKPQKPGTTPKKVTQKRKPKPKPVNNETVWQKYKSKIAGLSRSKVIRYLVAAGGLYLLYKWFTSEGETPFPPCLTTNMSEGDLQKMHDQGLEQVLISETGEPTVDSNGGGVFYDDKTFKTGNGRYKGKWSETGEGILIEIEGSSFTIPCGESATDDEDGTGGTGGTGGGSYTNCDSFPLSKGCKGSKVSDIQKCLGAKVDGKYGDETERKLKEKGYSSPVTQEVYDKIMKNCGSSNTDNDNTIVSDVQTGTDV